MVRAIVPNPAPPLILASSSRFRRALLARLGLPFESVSPAVDEREAPGEPAADLAPRLARLKAEAVADAMAVRPAVVIGSDQAPSLNGRILRKPGGRDAAIEQLLACQGRRVEFHTAVCVIETGSGRSWAHTDITQVDFLKLERAAIERYVDIEEPFDSAGGFKAEGLGITLFAAIRSEDPTGLIGLPLVRLTGMLRAAGLDPLAPTAPAAVLPAG